MPRPAIRFFFDTDSRMALTRSAALLALAAFALVGQRLFALLRRGRAAPAVAGP